MTKIRKFFGIGRKPRKNEQKEQTNALENFIVGSTGQKISEEDRLKLKIRSKTDNRTDERKETLS